MDGENPEKDETYSGGYVKHAQRTAHVLVLGEDDQRIDVR